ncbi:hypothetical protein B0H34DRAFT_730559 [Crassisporium funariophilum]|nr:hypothetical protein B0H34DRAFT_730559 [Crassisporium funariophilum]
MSTSGILFAFGALEHVLTLCTYLLVFPCPHKTGPCQSSLRGCQQGTHLRHRHDIRGNALVRCSKSSQPSVVRFCLAAQKC